MGSLGHTGGDFQCQNRTGTAWPLYVLPTLPGRHPATLFSLVLSPLPSCPVHSSAGSSAGVTRHRLRVLVASGPPDSRPSCCLCHPCWPVSSILGLQTHVRSTDAQVCTCLGCLRAPGTQHAPHWAPPPWAAQARRTPWDLLLLATQPQGQVSPLTSLDLPPAPKSKS